MRKERAEGSGFSTWRAAGLLFASGFALASCGGPPGNGQVSVVRAALHGDSLTDPLVFVPTGIVPNSNPPDTNGDVGRDHYVQMVNPDRFQVWNKRGQQVSTMGELASLWPAGDPCRAQGVDVIVMYDHLADRWVLLHGESHYLCIAVSRTADPTNTDASGWYAYSFDAAGFPGDPSFPDFPKLAVWPDAYYMSSVGLDPSQAPVDPDERHASNAIYALDRAKMLVGACSPTASCLKRTTIDDNANHRPFPADLDGPAPVPGTPGIFVRAMDNNDDPNGAPDHIEVFGAAVNWSTGTFSFSLLASLPVASFTNLVGHRHGFQTGAACAPQPHTTDTIDCMARTQAILRYRRFATYSSIVMLNVVDVRDQVTTFSPQEEVIGIRWYELRSQSGTWSLYQEGTFGPQPNTTDESKLIHRWMANANMDREGNIALGYNAVNSTNDPGQEIYPSIWYTGRNADAPLGTMSPLEHVALAGLNSQQAENGITGADGGVLPGRWARWGDYSSMSVDPVDGCTFWYTNHVADVPGQPKPTPITAFKFAHCAPAARQTCVFGSQRVDLRDRARINATVGAVGSLEIGSVTTVIGDVSVSGNVLMRDRSGIEGDLTYSGTLTRQNGTSVVGTITRAAVTLAPPPAKTVAGGSGDQSVDNGQTITLSPGTFGNMTFRARSRVTMNAGTYTFASLNIEPDVIVTAAGPVNVNVQGQFQLGDRSRVVTPSRVAFSVHSNATNVRIGTDAAFNGNINAPNASVTVSSRTTFNGCLAGKTLLVDTDARLIEP